MSKKPKFRISYTTYGTLILRRWVFSIFPRKVYRHPFSSMIHEDRINWFSWCWMDYYNSEGKWKIAGYSIGPIS